MEVRYNMAEGRGWEHEVFSVCGPPGFEQSEHSSALTVGFRTGITTEYGDKPFAVKLTT